MDALPEQRRDSQFKDAVLSAAEARRVQIIAEAQKESKAQIEAAEKSCRLADHARITARYAQDAQRRHSAALQAARAELLGLREQLVDGVFAGVEARLAAFCESAAYEKWLVEHAAAHMGAAKAGGAVDVLLREKDMGHAAAIQKALPGCTVRPDAGIRLGGLKIADRRVLYDETLDEALRAERERFYAESGLFI